MISWTSPTHVCPAWHCKRDVPDELLMCGPHWKMVPPALQRAVYAAYDRGRGTGTQALLSAQQAAVRAADDQLREDATNA